MKTGEDDKIFGSVTSQMIFDSLLSNGFEGIEKRKIVLSEPIKSLGDHEVEIKLQHSVVAKITVSVVNENAAEIVEINEEAVTETENK